VYKLIMRIVPKLKRLSSGSKMSKRIRPPGILERRRLADEASDQERVHTRAERCRPNHRHSTCVPLQRDVIQNTTAARRRRINIAARRWQARC